MKISLAIFLAMLSFLGFRGSAQAVEVGDAAPRVSALDQNGAKINLGDLYSAGPVLVYFYPKADTPGCTAQACSLRDAFPDFTGEGVRVVGVSSDTPEAQKKFAAKHKLPFTLLADTDHAVAKAFGVPLIPLLGIPQRQSFIVRDGKVAWISRNAKTAEHAAEVQAALKQLAPAK